MRSRYDRLVLRRIALRAVSSFRRIIMSEEARCQANRGINAAVFQKQKKDYDSFRFLKLLCVHFGWDGTIASCGLYGYWAIYKTAEFWYSTDNISPLGMIIPLALPVLLIIVVWIM